MRQLSIQYQCNDIIKILSKDPDGKLYEKVSRIIAQSYYLNMELWFDINSHLFPIYVGDSLNLSIYTISDESFNSTIKDNQFSYLVDKYEYFMIGKVFNIITSIERETSFNLIYASFGGLLLKLKVKKKYLKSFLPNSHLCLGLNRLN
ncbi:DNA directed RNA polymerase subunit I/II/III (nucleomorph) [Bigelowiella natans]|uniref:DNA-directed RNA polymerases I, II, and III subunit RPABC3 n=1 Tax=Bigelowiella natans TaxID=227086 RepID=Q40944_BIGNA|nr:DNA directed RNA polymerase subunit I/II/III [Bigelowiella natans]AAD05371.1 putative RNA polymerase II subunit [Bigelowiella natans]ABA27352.1 DNA directed RNA polymerase subunit I/II/III [Bigelowiella natans]